MKNQIITFISTLIIAAFFVQSSLAQDHSGHHHDEHLGKLITSYLHMKDALAGDDFDTARDHMTSIAEEVLSSREMNHHPEHPAKHEKHHGAMAIVVKQATAAETIEELRDSFSGITEQLRKAVENLGYAGGPVYVQFCPMANGGNGAKWLSDKEEILNPYYGARMLRCGSVIEQIHS